MDTITPMPIYQYESLEDCSICGGQFEITQQMSEPHLTECPSCKKPCKKMITSFNTREGKMGFNLTKAKASGFAVLKRRDHGVFEKL